MSACCVHRPPTGKQSETERKHEGPCKRALAKLTHRTSRHHVGLRPLPWASRALPLKKTRSLWPSLEGGSREPALLGRRPKHVD
eukprot:8469944-Pyramimonas_sp.AAC.1